MRSRIPKRLIARGDRIEWALGTNRRSAAHIPHRLVLQFEVGIGSITPGHDGGLVVSYRVGCQETPAMVLVDLIIQRQDGSTVTEPYEEVRVIGQEYQSDAV
jgi:hypothetical protein